MELIQNSQDILNLAKTIGVLSLSFLTAWFLFYLVMIFRSLFKVVKELKDKLDKFDEILNHFKKKIEHSTSALVLMSEGIKKIVEIAKDHTGKNKK